MTTTENGFSQSILLIGSGRLAKHLFYWNSLLDKPNQILTWDRSQDPHALNRFLQKASIVWLAISDTAIVPFYEKFLAGLDHTVVHFSGALHDVRMVSAHPMMSFPTELMKPENYAAISFAVTGVDSLAKALPNFSNSSFQISAEQKALYHSLCVVAGNFPQMLWSESAKKFSELGVPSSAFQTYITQVLNNYLALGEKSVTGPIARKDMVTIEKNQHALTGSKLKSIYQSFVKEFLA